MSHMKVQSQLTRGGGGASLFHHHHHEPPPTALTLGYKRLRHIAPKLNSFLNPPRTLLRESSASSSSSQVEITLPGGGTRWNPTQEQIGILEMLYTNGMRTPNANQIEEITSRLAKFGKIEGKNVFYWFQNHKARERQKLKRNAAAVATAVPLPKEALVVEEEEDRGGWKRKCMTWKFEWSEEEEEDKTTLELFPLHPEGR